MSLRHMPQPLHPHSDSPVGPARQGARPDDKEPVYLLHAGIWHCFIPGAVIHAGLGYDKEAAYLDWERINRSSGGSAGVN
jgi:hypothetical protein